eukprot:scaffold136161_cov36-Cyclotella_meneghiniana.AAC.3
MVQTPGRPPSGFGNEGVLNSFHGGTIFVDAATGIVWVENQVSLGGGETVMAKIRFEEWLWEHKLVLKSPICIAIMVCSLQMPSGRTVLPSDRVKASLE